MTPFKHAQSSAAKFGGEPIDYIKIHDWFDETKAYTGDWTHRAIRHHAAGIQWCVEKFNHVVLNSKGQLIPVKVIAEQHVIEDCGFIPTIQDWLKPIKAFPHDWMLKVGTTTTEKLEIR